MSSAAPTGGLGGAIGAGAGAAAGVALGTRAPVPPSTPLLRRAVSIPPGKGTTTYALSLTENFRVEAATFAVDTTNALQTDDIRFDFLTQTGDELVGQTVGLAQATGLVVTYAVAPNLNPCDGVVYAATGLTPDTFADVTLVSGCKVRIQALTTSAGVLDTAALITGGILWVEDVASPDFGLLAPVYLPVPIFGAAAA